MYLYIGVHRTKSLMSLSLLLQQYPGCLANFSWMVCKMGGNWLYNCCFVGYSFQNLFRIACISLCSFHLAFSPSVSLDPKWWSFNTTDMPTARKNLFGFYRRSDFHMVVNLYIRVLPMHILTSFSVDEIFLLSYINWSTNLRDLPFIVEMALSQTHELFYLSSHKD